MVVQHSSDYISKQFSFQWKLTVFTITLWYNDVHQENRDTISNGSEIACCPVQKPVDLCRSSQCFCNTINNNGIPLSGLEEMLSLPGHNKAFYFETSGRSGLNPRQACGVESLALHNPNLTIYVLTTAGKNLAGTVDYVKGIQKKHGNVISGNIDLNVYFAGTLLERWLHCSNWTSGRYKVAHLSDALRVLSLWKYGGYYFDFDLIHLRSVDQYKNFVALEDQDYAGNAALHAERKHPLFTEILMEFDRTYRADLWAHNGPGCITRILQRFCNQNNTSKMNYITCNGFNIFPYPTFYPVYYVEPPELFTQPPTYNLSDAKWLTDVTLAVHVWNSKTHSCPVNKSSLQLYVQLAKYHCPLTIASAPDVF